MEDILIKMKETHALLITKQQQQQEKCSKKSMLDNKTWITWETFVSLNHRQKKTDTLLLQQLCESEKQYWIGMRQFVQEEQRCCSAHAETALALAFVYVMAVSF